MAPHPTPRATLAFLGCVSLHLSGLWLQVPLLIWLGASGLVGVSLCLSLTLRAGIRLRRLRLEFGWDAPSDSAAEGLPVGLSRPRTVSGYFQNHGERSATLTGLRPAMPEALEVVESPAAVRAEARSRTAFELRFRSQAIGRWVIQGLSVSVPGPLGLFVAPLYFPTPLAVRVLPPAAAPLQGGKSPVAHETGTVRAPLSPQQSGRGSEFRELRALQPGDPYHTIAWKPSARRGQLLARVNEQEHERTLIVILDVGESTRAGPTGYRPLDRGLVLAASLVHRALHADDRAGLLTIDARIIDHVPARSGPNHGRPIQQALLAVSQLVDQDLTGISEGQVQAHVLRYLRRQGGLPTLEPKAQAQDIVNQQLLLRAVRVAREEDDKRAIVGENGQDVLLRRFCRRRGIALPYQKPADPNRRALALAQALRRATGNSRSPHDLILLLGADYPTEHRSLQRALAATQRQGHRIQVVQLTSPNLGPDTRVLTVKSNSEALSITAELAHARQHEELRVWFSRMRCPTYPLTNDSALTALCLKIERAPRFEEQLRRKLNDI